MAFGDSPHDEALRAAWKDFCKRLEDAGERLFSDHIPATPLHRADGFRFLAQNLGQAFDLALETKDTRYPAIHTFVTPYCKLGGDNADFTYQQSWIDGNSVYRISGNKGTARFLNFTVQGPRPETMPGTDYPSLQEPFGDVPEANIFGHQLQAAWDGSFELYIGGPKRGPNWAPTTPGTRKLFIRQGFDRWEELPARMRIERIDMSEPSPMPTPETIIEAVGWAGRFMTGLMTDWPEHPYKYSALSGNPTNPNVFPQDNPDSDSGKDKLRGRSISNMHWRLGVDDALIIEFDGRDRFWMISNMGALFNSLDYLYRPVSYTPSRTKTDSDGMTRLVLCHDDPGYHNWIDTQEFEVGNMTFRNLHSEQPTVLRTRLVKRNAVAKALPGDSVKVTKAERTAHAWTRFNAIRQRYLL